MKSTEEKIVDILKEELDAEGFMRNFKITGKHRAAKRILGLFTQYATHSTEENGKKRKN